MILGNPRKRFRSLDQGFDRSGVEDDIGLCGTEMVYYATPALDADGGIMITASHNPPEYNGMKFVKKGSVPVGYDSGLKEMEKMILKNEIAPKSAKRGTVSQQDVLSRFINNLKRFYDAGKIKKYKIVVNAGNGCAGLALTELEKDLPIKMIKVLMSRIHFKMVFRIHYC
jgi:phosphomannomutase